MREYLAVVTRSQIWSAPLPMSDALKDVSWLLGGFDILENGPNVTQQLIDLCRDVPVAGRQIHDANIAATMLAHAEMRLFTFDQDDFRRYGDRIVLIDPARGDPDVF